MKRNHNQLEVLRRCLDGEASAEEFAQLEELLRNDPEFRMEYLRYLNIDSALAALPKNRERDGRDPMVPLQDSEAGSRFGWPAALVAAAAMLLLAGILIYLVFDRGRGVQTTEMVDGDSTEPAEVNDDGVAVLTRAVGVQGGDSANWRVGETIPPGTMAWEAGLLQLEFYGGATVVVEGPAEVEILDESRLVCRSGRLRAHVPDQASGFTVRAPSFELVDLGTEFGLDVGSDGAAEVHVFDGKVELYEADSNRNPASRRELNAGDALTLDREGISEPIAARNADFITPTRLTQMTEAKRKEQLLGWHAFRDSLREDPRVVAYFPFDRTDAEDRLLVGHGAKGTVLTGAIVGCEWSAGRWSGEPCPRD